MSIAFSGSLQKERKRESERKEIYEQKKSKREEKEKIEWIKREDR
jgi:hypothetical protein